MVSAGIDVAFPTTEPATAPGAAPVPAPPAPQVTPATTPADRTPVAQTHERRYQILDALRFLLAFWVAVAHFGTFPLFAGIDTTTSLGYVTMHAWNSLVMGIPAVIVFFVISGFCIHWPFRHGEPFSITRYYARRYTRILVPVAAALWIYAASGMKIRWLGEHSILWESVLWSLACEEIYYAAYPVIIWLKKRFTWRLVIPASFAASIACSSAATKELEFRALGPFLTASILLPVWLLGCLLAEQAETIPTQKPALSIWFWRFLAWAASCVCGFLNFKLQVGWTQTLLWFGLLAYFWVKQELAHNRRRQPSRLLVMAGAWSYSLYLVHAPARRFYDQLAVPNFGYTMNWVLSYAFILLFAFLFYRAVEKPSHAFARKIRVHLAPRQTNALAEKTLNSPIPAAANRDSNPAASASTSTAPPASETAVAATAGSAPSQTPTRSR